MYVPRCLPRIPPRRVHTLWRMLPPTPQHPVHAQTAEFLAIADLQGSRDSSSNDIVRLAAPLSASAVEKYLKSLIRESTVRGWPQSCSCAYVSFCGLGFSFGVAFVLDGWLHGSGRARCATCLLVFSCASSDRAYLLGIPTSALKHMICLVAEHLFIVPYPRFRLLPCLSELAWPSEHCPCFCGPMNGWI